MELNMKKNIILLLICFSDISLFAEIGQVIVNQSFTAGRPLNFSYSCEVYYKNNMRYLIPGTFRFTNDSYSWSQGAGDPGTGQSGTATYSSTGEFKISEEQDKSVIQIYGVVGSTGSQPTKQLLRTDEYARDSSSPQYDAVTLISGSDVTLPVNGVTKYFMGSKSKEKITSFLSNFSLKFSDPQTDIRSLNYVVDSYVSGSLNSSSSFSNAVDAANFINTSSASVFRIRIIAINYVYLSSASVQVELTFVSPVTLVPSNMSVTTSAQKIAQSDVISGRCAVNIQGVQTVQKFVIKKIGADPTLDTVYEINASTTDGSMYSFSHNITSNGYYNIACVDNFGNTSNEVGITVDSVDTVPPPDTSIRSITNQYMVNNIPYIRTRTNNETLPYRLTFIVNEVLDLGLSYYDQQRSIQTGHAASGVRYRVVIKNSNNITFPTLNSVNDSSAPTNEVRCWEAETSLSDGSYSAQVQAYDALGNSSFNSSTFAFVIDNSAPTISLTRGSTPISLSNIGNAVTTYGNTDTYDVSASDGSPLDSFFNINVSSFAGAEGITSRVNSNQIRVNTGVNYLALKVEDCVGNATIKYARIIYDNEAPPSNSAIFCNSDGHQIVATKRYNESKIKIKIPQSGNKSGYLYAYPQSLKYELKNTSSILKTGTVTFEPEPNTTDYIAEVDLGENLDSGTYSLNWSVTDIAGNSSAESQYQFTRRTTIQAISNTNIQRSYKPESQNGTGPVNSSLIGGNWCMGYDVAVGLSNSTLFDGFIITYEDQFAFKDYSYKLFEFVNNDLQIIASASNFDVPGTFSHYFKWSPDVNVKTFKIVITNDVGESTEPFVFTLFKPYVHHAWFDFDNDNVTKNYHVDTFSLTWNSPTKNLSDKPGIFTLSNSIVYRDKDMPVPATVGRDDLVQLGSEFTYIKQSLVTCQGVENACPIQISKSVKYTPPFDKITLPDDSLLGEVWFGKDDHDVALSSNTSSILTQVADGSNRCWGFEVFDCKKDNFTHFIIPFDLKNMKYNIPAHTKIKNLSNPAIRLIAWYGEINSQNKTNTRSNSSSPLQVDLNPPTIAERTGLLADRSDMITARNVKDFTFNVNYDNSGLATENAVIVEYTTKKTNGAWDFSNSTCIDLTIESGGSINSKIIKGSLVDGHYGLQIRVTDKAGNSFITDPFTRVIDTSKPSLLASDKTGFLNNGFATADGKIYFEFVANDDGKSGVYQVEYAWGSTATWESALPFVFSEKDDKYTAPDPSNCWEHEKEDFRVLLEKVPEGATQLYIKLKDRAGNESAKSYTSSAWIAKYQSQVPAVSITLPGLTNDKKWLAALPLSASLSYVQPENKDNPIASTCWGLQEHNPDLSTSVQWGEWDKAQSFALKDGGTYSVVALIKNRNGVLSDKIESASFIFDSRVPVFNINEWQAQVIAGKNIKVNISNAVATGITWTWGYKTRTGREKSGTNWHSQDVISLPEPGIYDVWWEATSGAGLRYKITKTVTVIEGLHANVNRLFFSPAGSLSGSWGYSGSKEVSQYQYQWIQKSTGKVLAYGIGDATQSVVIDFDKFQEISWNPQDDGIRLSVTAVYASGTQETATSMEAKLQTTGPVVEISQAPQYAPLNKVWLSLKAHDSVSGLVGGEVRVYKHTTTTTNTTGISYSTLKLLHTLPITHLLPHVGIAGALRIDLDLAAYAASISEGDNLVLDVALSNGAGMTQSAQTGMICIDNTAPPVPLIVTPVKAINWNPPDSKSQAVTFDFSFSTPDAISNTVKYLVSPYYDTLSPEAAQWTEITNLTGENLQYTVTFSSPPTCPGNGHVLHLAVKAVNGAGLVSTAYSNGVMLDSTAPLIYAVQAVANGSEIAGYAIKSNISNGLEAKVSAWNEFSNLSGFSVQLGSWTVDNEYQLINGVSPFNFSVPNTTYTTLTSTNKVNFTHVEDTIYMLQGTVQNEAGTTSVLLSRPFKVIVEPKIKNLQTALSCTTLSANWTITGTASCIKRYEVVLQKRNSTGSFTTIATKNVDQTTRQVSFELQDIGASNLSPGDLLKLVVNLISPVASSSNYSFQYYWPYAPELTALNYTRYFSNRLNVRSISFGVTPQPADSVIGIRLIQWRMFDVGSNAILQDWVDDYNGASSQFLNPYADFIEQSSLWPEHDEQIRLQFRAQSTAGIWSDIVDTQNITTDLTAATNVSVRRFKAGSEEQENLYSNANGNTGGIEGWTLGAVDAESGLNGYQVLLSTSSTGANLDWSTATSVNLTTLPAVVWKTASPITIPGATSQSFYYAWVRMQNGTDDWGAPVRSNAVDVNWTAPQLTFVFNDFMTLNVDTSKNHITNNLSESIEIQSDKREVNLQWFSNGTVLGSTVSTDLADNSGDYVSYSSIQVTKPIGNPSGEQEISVIGTDLYGNVHTSFGHIRYNSPPDLQKNSARFATGLYKTTPGKPVYLESLVNVMDDPRDTSYTCTWSLNGGAVIPGQNYSNKVVSPWPTIDSAMSFTTYDQDQWSQDTRYQAHLTVRDRWGAESAIDLPIQVLNTKQGRIYANENWTGKINLEGMVIIPSGLTVVARNAEITVNGSVNSRRVMLGGLNVEAGGTLRFEGKGSSSSMEPAFPGQLWQGLFVSGTLQTDPEYGGLSINNAEQGIVLLSAGSVDISMVTLQDGQIGLHLLGGTAKVSNCSITGYSDYAIKEDIPAGGYQLTDINFTDNLVLYYQYDGTLLTIDQLNQKKDCSGNTESK